MYVVNLLMLLQKTGCMGCQNIINILVKTFLFQSKKWLFEFFHLHTAKSRFLHSEIKLLVDVGDRRKYA